VRPHRDQAGPDLVDHAEDLLQVLSPPRVIVHVEGLSRGVDLSESSLHTFEADLLPLGFGERDGRLGDVGRSLRDQIGLQVVESQQSGWLSTASAQAIR
jgi:hypothetical protein